MNKKNNSLNTQREAFLRIEWDKEKNEWLKRERGINFETIEKMIKHNNYIKIIDNPNQDKYPKQKAILVEINSYICFVPFSIENGIIKLKSIIPSRKLNKEYNPKD